MQCENLGFRVKIELGLKPITLSGAYLGFWEDICEFEVLHSACFIIQVHEFDESLKRNAT